MKLSRLQIKQINDFLQNNSGNFMGNQKTITRKIIPGGSSKFYNLESMDKSLFRGRKAFKGINGESDNRIIKNRSFVDSIIYGVLSKLPELDRPKNLEHIYHYTNAYTGIKENGLRASNFLNNSNDVQEVTYLLEHLSITDSQYVNIYNKSIIKRYNSFAYEEIDHLAWTYYLKGNGNSEFNKIVTTVEAIEKKFVISNSAEYLIHGFVRYDVSGKRAAMEYLNNIIKKFWSTSVLPDYIIEIISILTTFVKRKCSDSKGDNREFWNYRYKSEKEYRFLYNNIKKRGIPYHKLEIEDDWWEKCDENNITNSCKKLTNVSFYASTCG